MNGDSFGARPAVLRTLPARPNAMTKYVPPNPGFAGIPVRDEIRFDNRLEPAVQ